METFAPFEVLTDSSRNLLHIRFRGHVTPSDMQACQDQVDRVVPQLRTGFSLLTDLSDLTTMEVDCVAALTKIMDRIRAGGVRTVVRVVPDPDKDIGLKILSIIHYRRGVRIVTCETLAEAESTLPAP